MYHATTGATAGTLAFTGTVLDSGWLLVLAVTAVFAGLAIRKIFPTRKRADRG